MTEEDRDRLNFDNLFNPCKSCLKRPVCKSECEDFNEHKSMIDFTWFITLSSVLFIAFFVGLIVFYKINSQTWFYIFLALAGIGYMSAINAVIKDLDDFIGMKVWERIAAFILFPFGTSGYILYRFSGLEDHCEKYAYRYNKPLYNRMQRGR